MASQTPSTALGPSRQHKRGVLAQCATKAIEEAGVRDKVKIMVGGASVAQAFADQIGADGYASNAAGAAELAKRLVSAA